MPTSSRVPLLRLVAAENLRVGDRVAIYSGRRQQPTIARIQRLLSFPGHIEFWCSNGLYQNLKVGTQISIEA